MGASFLFCLFASFLATCLSQLAPFWGTAECGDIIKDRFYPGDQWDYTRYYEVSIDYPGSTLARNVTLSSCTDDEDFEVSLESELYLASYPESSVDSGVSGDCDDYGYDYGDVYTFSRLAEGSTYVIGITNDESTAGGVYEVMVDCHDPPTPPPSAPINITDPFTLKHEWKSQGERDISCNKIAYYTDVNVSEPQVFQFTVLDYQTQIYFDSCGGASTNFGDHTLDLWTWTYVNQTNSTWNWTRDSTDADSCVSQRWWDINPGIHYVALRPDSGYNDGDYSLEMKCWDNEGVMNASNFNEYTVTTSFDPTTTVDDSTSTTNTINPTYAFNMTDIKSKHSKRLTDEGDISCGIYRKGKLKERRRHYYTFQLNATQSYLTFDTCYNDDTRFESTISLYKWDGYNWEEEESQSSNSGSYCNAANWFGSYTSGLYVVVIQGASEPDDKGSYVLKMGCDDYSAAMTVDKTERPTPQPTGQSPIPSRNDKVEGATTCGVTLEGTVPKRGADFYKFTVKKGGLDWVKFDTCDNTKFENYLFVYTYHNYSEKWAYTRDNSVGFDYEEDSKCNDLIINDLGMGEYYVMIEGFNYFFDYGDYTIHMSCSDNSQVQSTSAYTEYGASALEDWEIALIVVACFLCCVILVVVIFCVVKKKKEGGDSGGGGGSGNNEMTDMKATDEDGGE